VPCPSGKIPASSVRSESLTMSARLREVSIFRTTSCTGSFARVRLRMTTGRPVVMSPYMPAAEMPIPC